MSHARVLGILGIAVFAVAAVAYAQTTITPIPDNAPVETAPLDNAPVVWGDVKAGATKAGTCAACHTDATIMERHGLPVNQHWEYSQSVHGQALLFRGDPAAPHCASSHGCPERARP